MRPQHALGVTVCVQHKCIISRWQEIWFLGSCESPDSIFTAQFQLKQLIYKKKGRCDLVWIHAQFCIGYFCVLIEDEIVFVGHILRSQTFCDSVDFCCLRCRCFWEASGLPTTNMKQIVRTAICSCCHKWWRCMLPHWVLRVTGAFLS